MSDIGLIEKIEELEKELEGLRKFTGFEKTYYPNYPYKRIEHSGYWEIYSKDCIFNWELDAIGANGRHLHRSEHRYLMEQKLGYKIPDNLIVHHKDGNRCNNKISNLELLTRSEHGKIHYRKNFKNGGTK